MRAKEAQAIAEANKRSFLDDKIYPKIKLKAECGRFSVRFDFDYRFKNEIKKAKYSLEENGYNCRIYYNE